MKIALSLLGALGTVLAGSSQAATIAGWNFDSSPPTGFGSSSPVVTADTGSGSFTGFHASNSTSWAINVGNASPNAYSVDNWSVGDYLQFSTSTAGYEDITIGFDKLSHPNGARDFQLSYSTDGSNFTNFGSVYTVDAASPSQSWWDGVTHEPNTSYAFDLSGITALDNATTVYFRLSLTSTVNANGGAGGPLLTSSTRIDNVSISGTAVVPEPSVSLLGALGMLGLLRRRR
ncbi:hypothetical protein [Luteolibacter luteus]|uniref:PEP-CTERM sorting domain-containing protein n=1 Tax=Luteolibacter luteus TaxID=2728835 RepID=A0A858REG0_9BACT|nr:hypothetical protein [Luteolibacter luteus]QJE94700.1 hypothetical protein HHL09_02525 [Luteolibacter luteus]